MDEWSTFVAMRNPQILNKSNYEYWKARMMADIRGIDEEAWISVQYGWETPKMFNEQRVLIAKPYKLWTDEEKKLSKFNFKALSVIFHGVVDISQLKLIQHCKSAKEAWDILQKTFERTLWEKREQLHVLASQFESLRMGEQDKVANFCSEIVSIASEAEALGKKYKEKKLVKKLLQCLPAKFAVLKTAIRTSFKIDDLKFDKAKEMVMVYEMDLEMDRLRMK